LAIEQIHAMQTVDFGGILSVLYAGDVAVAGHFGMYSNGIWHYWFPSYARDYSRYSPGLVLLLKMAESANQLGLSVVDLGKGEMLYKHRLKNGEVALAEGNVELSPWRALRRSAEGRLRAVIEKSALRQPLRKAIHSLRRLRGLRAQGLMDGGRLP
jgi:CelD/BcsL family acetyltransferase involved in cellulose biosynthesis